MQYLNYKITFKDLGLFHFGFSLQDEVMKSQDEDKTELHELVTVTELYQTVPLEGEGVTSSGPSVDIEPGEAT